MKLCNARVLFIHRWGDWMYATSQDCTKTRKCRVCGLTDPQYLPDQHRWGDWMYATSQDCTKTRKCSACGLTDPQHLPNQHVWEYESTGNWEDGETGNRRHCTHCKKKQREHYWKEVVQIAYADPGSGYAEEWFTEWRDE